MQCRPGLWTRFARYPRSQNVPYFTTQELVVREGGGVSRRYLHHWWPKKCNVGNKTKRKNRKYSWLHNENDLIKHNQNHHESETVDVQGYKIWQDIAWKLFCENPLVWRCFFFLDSPQFSRVQNTENRVSRSFFGPHATPRPETLATQASEDVGVMSKRLNRLN